MKFALITPSYAPDFERCQLLCSSVQRFISPPFTHYLVVDKQDNALFRQLESSNTVILTKESLLPWWIQRIPFTNIWLSLKTIPIRGWVIQQIIKIATAQQIDEDIAIFVDSDVMFVRPFELQQLSQNEKVRLYIDSRGNEIQKQWHFKWHESASRLLGLADIEMTLPDYIGQIITWKRDNVIQLCSHLESISGRGWIETLSNNWNLSEYVLYGIFINRILKEKSGHYYDSENICLDYWLTEPLSNQGLKDFVHSIHPKQAAIMISAKSRTPVEYCKTLLEDI